MSAIHDDLHAVQVGVTEALLHEFDVASAGVVDAIGFADLVAGHAVRLHVIEDLLFDERLEIVGKLVPIGSEDLETIVLIGVMRSRQHDAGAAAHGLRQVSDRRRRHRAYQEDVHAARHQAARQRGLEHVAGDTRVLADDDTVMIGAAGAQHTGDRLSDAEGDLGRDRVFVRLAADAVCSEEFGRHAVIRPFLPLLASPND